MPDAVPPTSLSDQCRETREAAMQQLPDEDKQIMQAASGRLMDSIFGEHALRTNDECIDFTLPECRGGEVNLQSRLEQGPVVLSFYRGSWCPFCNLEMRALLEAFPEIQTLGGRVIALSPEMPDQNQFDLSEIPDGFDILFDEHNRVAREYGLVMQVFDSLHPLYLKWGYDIPQRNGNGSWELPIPATYVIDREGVIRAHYVDKNYTTRMEPAEIISSLKSL